MCDFTVYGPSEVQSNIMFKPIWTTPPFKTHRNHNGSLHHWWRDTVWFIYNAVSWIFMLLAELIAFRRDCRGEKEIRFAKRSNIKFSGSNRSASFTQSH